MQPVSRFALLALLITMPAGLLSAADPEYKRSDTNFYWKGDVLKVEPNAVIVPAGGYTQKGDSYFVTGKKKAAKEIYVQVLNDWIEPITAPDMAPLGVAPDAMQIREPQGDVQVALPSAPANFVAATDKMTIPNGAVVKTGANGTAAVLFGGVESARLIPNSEAAVQQTVTPKARTTEIDLSKGAIFSKVGKQVGVTQDYKVKTPFGVAAARGTDFVSVAMPARNDVWIAEGTVSLDEPNGKLVGTVKSDGGGLKIIRFPVMADAKQAMMASSETMTAAMDFIPMANVKVKALRAKVSEGQKLTPNEQAYMARIKKVPCLMKLALVEPPAPPPAPVPPPKPPKLTLEVHGDSVQIGADKLTLDALKTKLQESNTKDPETAYTINVHNDTTEEQAKAVTDLGTSLALKHVTVKAPKKYKKAPKVAAPTVAPAAATPTTTPAPTPAAAPSPAAAPAKAPATVTLGVHADGKVRYNGTNLRMDELKPKLEELIKANPEQAIVIGARPTVKYETIKPVADLCTSLSAKNVTYKVNNKETLAKLKGEAPAAKPAPAPAPSTGNDSMQPSTISSNAPPVSPIAPKAKMKASPRPIDESPAGTIP